MFLGRNETAVFEKMDMLHERRQGHVERRGEIADTGRPTAQSRQNGPARGVGQRLKDVVEFARILIHKAKYHDEKLSARSKCSSKASTLLLT